MDVTNLLKPLASEFPDDSFECKGKVFKCNGEVCGYAVPLSTAVTKKSVSYNDVWLIIYDEFLIDSDHYRYLKNEVKAFLDFYETVNRLRIDRPEVIVFFLANALTLYNIYFNYFGIKFRDGKTIYKSDDIYAEIAYKQEFADEKKKTRFGRLIAGTEYEDYSLYNNFYMDDGKFIEKKTPNARHYCNFIIGGVKYGVWVDWETGIVYLSYKIDPSTKANFCFSTKDQHYNSIMLSGVNRSTNMRLFIIAATHGDLRYEDQNIKNNTADIVQLLCGR